MTVEELLKRQEMFILYPKGGDCLSFVASTLSTHDRNPSMRIDQLTGSIPVLFLRSTKATFSRILGKRQTNYNYDENYLKRKIREKRSESRLVCLFPRMLCPTTGSWREYQA